ncbi:glycoside hydrolase family 15 protein [Micromonospora mirobrigensis]|uniref:Glucoamylase (Glucan-1,4-alpha-glucosidase), GH15 family n=1 Tax=Micromonospora mirobrigensis TaxID=262898 RepID=A0A1C4Z4Q3_9ACTN|nr:glycoside hydrolase family 15 protein [Micromonospora mirobrigensis]SCF27886.1 Glucoamylase (glucan-1,4-alpha-glucosidase), GH15 family [Micromonospora mirobrigensis]
MEAYPAVENHGLIGDLQTAALVTRDGTLDWFCAPRFDSPSIFGGLLDRQRGGHFQISPCDVDYVSRQIYLPGTAILITRFLSADGVGEVVDFMPVAGAVATDHHCIVRMIRVVRGSMRFRMDCQPRFDYGRRPHTVDFTLEGTVFRSGDLTLTVNPVRRDGMLLDERDFDHDEHGGVTATGVLRQGHTGGVVLHTQSPEPPRVVSPAEVLELYEQTREFWRRWLGGSRYTGRWREMVERSAMTLKLMTYAPTGGLVAAPTAGLPEQIGGERNWDYRYTWVRDASFSVHALLSLGFTAEARGYLDWLTERIRDAEQSGESLQIMYRVDGSRELGEEVLPHLEGYRGSRPVRIGNDAAAQLQLDIFGEAMNCLHLADIEGLPSSYQEWRNTTKVLDWLCDHWDQPEDGIWETRGGRQDFTYGRLMSWVAFDRGIRLAQRHGRPADVARWTAERDAAYEQIMTRGFHPGRGAFVQHYACDVLDASLLAMPTVGFIAPRDPMWQSTLRAMDAELVSDSLVYRYDPEASPDGLPGAEGTFTMCTFWYVQALAESGRLDDARLTFEKMLTYSSHLGLYSEEIAPSGEQIGNFPQAFSHLSLISTAGVLDRLLDAER